MIAKLLTERPTRVRTVRDTVAEGIDHAVAKALAKVDALAWRGGSDTGKGWGAGGEAGEVQGHSVLGAG